MTNQDKVLTTLSERLDRIEAVLNELMLPGGFFDPSKPYAIWHGLPKTVVHPKLPAPKRSWWKI
jgi:hypothetical protein